ncbi:uncharacterized protein LOC108464887 [Gossypium arboreum]|uniref:uncharacterized protein LOC108464887 n=1 Tax=Gossypium arboreum TaxID=29729 RepID=UPI0008193A59|nr:uncharacterized protein LOC108464887 [Gossypium arboreum]
MASGWQSTSDWGRYETSRRKDNILPTTSIGEWTSFLADDGGSDDESDTDPPREPGPDGVKVGLFFESEPVPTILKDVEGGSDEEEEDPRFRARRDRTSSTLDSGEIEVGRKFSNKDSFLAALKQHSIMNEVNYNMVKSKSDKFEAKCVSQDHPKMDSDMIASLILPTLNADSKTSVSVLITNICSQLKYTPSYRKVWIAKQKAFEKMHGRWDASYNEVWQWCQVLERYVLGCITDLETTLAYYNDRLLRGCLVFKRLYTHQLLLAVTQDGSERIIPIVFAITPEESADD